MRYFTLKIVLAFVRVLEHNTVMDSRLARVELKERIMKTQYFAEASVTATGAKLATFRFVKITTAEALNDFVADVAKRNGIGCATIQIVPVDRDTFQKQPSFISGGQFLNK